MAVGLDWIRERTDNVLVARVGCYVLQILGEGFAGNREAVAMQQSGIEQHLHEWRESADARQVSHPVFPRRSEIGEHGYFFPNAREVIDRKLHIGGVRHREEVKHGVGRTAERDYDRDRVFKRL